MGRYVIEETFEYLGYECKIVFRDWGGRCGYIKIPKDHPFYYESYDFCNKFVDCHGGLTFAGIFLDDEESTTGSWVGFDCCHCEDKIDIEACKEYFPDAYSNDWYAAWESFNDWRVTRTKEFCEEELKRLALQLETARNVIEYFHVNIKEETK